MSWLKSSPNSRKQFAHAAMLHTNLQVVMQHNDMREFFVEDNLADASFRMVDPRNIRMMLDEAAEAAAKESKKAAREAAAIAAAAAAEAERLQAEEQRNARPRRPPPIEIPRPLAYLAVTAIAASLFFAVSSWKERSSYQTQQAAVGPAKIEPVAAPPSIATVGKSIDAVWSNAKGAIGMGARLMPGPVRLDDGMAEIALDGGARVILEGPVSLDLLSSGRVRLTQGRMVAQVPEEAIGFTVSAGGASIVDLGTEFGIDMQREGDFGVHVLDGEVALKLKERAEPLLAGSARAVDASGLVSREIEADRHTFIRRVPASSYELAILKSRPTAFWRLNEFSNETSVKSLGSLELSSPAGAGAHTGAESRRSEADNRALELLAKHDGINVGYHPGLALANGFTIEAWVVTPPTLELPSPKRIISSFSESPDSGFALGVAGHAFAGSNDFPSMTLLFTFYGVYDCLAKVGLRPNNMYHVAAVVDDQGKPSLFIDGELVPAAVRGLEWPGYRPVPEIVSSDMQGLISRGPLFIGRNPPSQTGIYPPESWIGQIDEVAVFDKALSEEDIQSHYQAGLR
ncbi:FecR domain-containing protein [Aeoliella sp. ICT_H6.2]|uniref:FecR domain-containing protein n=1 Tax=Aeoliella straminimaris TaxID=2954799 RepID=A0A9X2FEP3_9BACT|nr:FecR domain-containing protein [Aeoliella straminimaris]